MISKDIIQYLQKDSTLVASLGGAEKICLVQAPTALKMPWLCVERAGGTAERTSAEKQRCIETIRVSVDVGATQKVLGSTIADRAKALLHNLRGTLGDTEELYNKCGAISEYAGLNGATRYSFICTADFIEPWALQRPST